MTVDRKVINDYNVQIAKLVNGNPIYYVYVLAFMNDAGIEFNDVLYVGKGCGQRFLQHFKLCFSL